MSPAHPDDNFNFDGTASLVPVRTTVVECEFWRRLKPSSFDQSKGSWRVRKCLRLSPNVLLFDDHATASRKRKNRKA